MNKFICSVAVVAASLAAAPVQAQPAAGDLYTASVRYADLNLASAEGLATFQGRVEAAAERTCGPARSAAVGDAQSVKACREALSRSAYAQLRPLLRTGTAEVLGTR